MRLVLIARKTIGSLSERTSFSLLTASLIYTVLLLSPEKQLNDSDTLWHVVLGKKILATWHLPQKDEFNYIFDGQPYFTNSWLSDVLLGAAYNMGGFPGLAMLSTFCVALTFFLLQDEYLRTLSSKFSIYFCCAVFLLLAPHVLSRPHVLVFPLVAIWAITLLRAEETGQAPPMMALLILFLWANMHGSFLLGFVITAPICLAGVVRDGVLDKEKARAWGLFLIGMFAVIFIGPYGLNPVKTAFSVLSIGPLLSSIPEWRPENFSSFGYFEAILLLMIGVLTYGGVRLSLARIVILLGLLHMALSHTRNSDYLAIIGSVVLAAPVGLSIRDRELDINSKRLLPAFLAMAVIGSLATFQLRAIVPPRSAYPIEAIRAAKEKGAQGRVFNDYAFGGALIFEGIDVLIDSRMEFYPRDFLQEYLDLMFAPDVDRLESFFNKNDIGWSILNPNTMAASLIARLPTWLEVYRDEVSVVHMRIGWASQNKETNADSFRAPSE